MSVTITDIARHLKVSHPVVSKVLHGGTSTTGVSEPMRRKIEAAALKMGYRPHAAGQWLRGGRFNAIGVLVGASDPFFHLPSHTISALTAGLTRHDFTCTLVSVPGLGQAELMACPLIKRNQVDSLIISYADQPADEMLRALAKVPVPIVWLHHGEATNSIVLDEAGASVQLTNHLHELGHRRVLFVDYSTGLNDPASLARLRAFEQRSHELGMDPLLMGSKKVPRENRFEVTRDWLKRRNAPRAVIVNSMSAALAILQTALHLGIRVPEDLAIASFDDGLHFNLGVPTVTAAIAPHQRLGELASELAVKLAAEPAYQQPPVRLPFELRIGGTTIASTYPAGSK